MIPDDPALRGSPVVVRCCFCGIEMFEEESGLVTLVVVGVPRPGKKQARSQQLWCHARCLGGGLHESADSDAGSFSD